MATIPLVVEQRQFELAGGLILSATRVDVISPDFRQTVRVNLGGLNLTISTTVDTAEEEATFSAHLFSNVLRQAISLAEQAIFHLEGQTTIVQTSGHSTAVETAVEDTE